MPKFEIFDRSQGFTLADPDITPITTYVRQNLDGTLTTTEDGTDPLVRRLDPDTGLIVPQRQIYGAIRVIPAVTAKILQLANGLQLTWPGSPSIVRYTVWVQRGGRLFYPVAFGTGTSWTDPEVSDGETVRYQVTGVDSSGVSSLIFDLTSTQQPRTYIDPVIITAPGTYHDLNINNEDPNGQAVRVKAGVQGVNIQNLRLRTRNDAIVLEAGAAANIQNVVAWARHPLVANRAKGKFLNASKPASVIAQHVSFEGFSIGLYADGQATTVCQKLLWQYWRSRNIDCRQTTSTGYAQVKQLEGHAFQVNHCFQVKEYDILDGVAIQEYQVGLVNDAGNNYVSSGLSTRKALISRNLIDGIWPFDGTADPNTALGGQSGCAFITDGDSDGTAAQNGNLEISYNLAVATSNYGYGIANGNGIEAHHNQGVTSGYLPDGVTVNRATNGGLYVSSAYAGTPNSTLSNANVHDNTMMCWNLIGSRNKPPGANNGYINNNAYDWSQVGQNGNVQTNNAYDNRAPDVALERAAHLAFVQAQSAASRAAGVTAF